MDADKIIVPLDVPSLDAAIALVEQLSPVSFWKVGLELFVSSGAEILAFLKAKGKRIFLDLKFHDIPNTISGACRSSAPYQVDFLTIHAVAGKKALTAAVETLSSLNSPTQLLAITVLTSLSPRELALDLKIPLELPEYVLMMALMAQESGIHGAVCSPQEVAQLRAVCGPDFLLVCPGIRPSWAQSQDQSRVMIPREAFRAGANYLVIGRPITQALNPLEAWQKLCAELS
jgi:orotidine-5'-phosphate decarboxylase